VKLPGPELRLVVFQELHQFFARPFRRRMSDKPGISFDGSEKPRAEFKAEIGGYSERAQQPYRIFPENSGRYRAYRFFLYVVETAAYVYYVFLPDSERKLACFFWKFELCVGVKRQRKCVYREVAPLKILFYRAALYRHYVYLKRVASARRHSPNPVFCVHLEAGRVYGFSQAFYSGFETGGRRDDEIQVPEFFTERGVPQRASDNIHFSEGI